MVEATTTAPLTEEQIKAQMTSAVTSGDWGLVKKLAAALDSLAKAAEKVAKDALQTKLGQLTAQVKDAITEALEALIDSGELDGADGIWYSQDFNAGNLIEVRLVKAKRAASTGGAAGKSSYVADPRKSADMLAVVGDVIMFEKETVVTIDKQEHTIPAGFTLQKAYDYSTNGGWRNRVRQALLRAANQEPS